MEQLTESLQTVSSYSQTISDNLTRPGFNPLPPEVEQVFSTLNSLQYLTHTISVETANPLTTKLLLDCLQQYLKQLCVCTRSLAPKPTKSDRESIVILQSRLASITAFVESAVHFPADGLFSLPRCHRRWTRLHSHSSVLIYPDPEKVRRNYTRAMLQVATGQTIIFSSFYAPSNLLSSFKLGASALYYSLCQGKALKKSKVFSANPSVKPTRLLWNLLENKAVNSLLGVLMDKVKCNKVIYVPRTAEHVLGYLQDRSPSTEFKFAKTEHHVIPVRVLHHQMIQALQRPQAAQSVFCDQLILHIHGGGFIAMSSASHQVYTRKWVKSLQIPCLSIDYRLSPGSAFPCALDDVWQVYNWVLHYAESQLGIKASRIYLAGDSAGGNLALALTYRAIESGLPLPQRLVLAYPALNLCKAQFTPSLILSLEDLLLSSPFLSLCIDSYVQDSALDPTTNYYISPDVAPTAILSRLPSVRILTGNADPLSDMCWSFLEKLLDAGTDAFLKIYDGATHGALNLALSGGVRESHDLVDQMAHWMSHLKT